jgi:hypothetical protein
LAFSTTKCDNTYTRLTLEDYKSCQIWLEEYNSPSTKRTYKIHLSLFCQYNNTNPDSLVQLKPEQIAKQQLESHLAAKIIEQDAIKKQLELLQVEKQNETHAMQQKYEQEMNAMGEQMNQIMLMIQQNPILAKVKPGVLVKKEMFS